MIDDVTDLLGDLDLWIVFLRFSFWERVDHHEEVLNSVIHLKGVILSLIFLFLDLDFWGLGGFSSMLSQ